MPAPRGRRRSTLEACASASSAASRTDGSLGVGIVDVFCEQAAHGTSRLCRLGHPDGAGLRAGHGAPDPRWRSGTAGRHPQPRPGTGDDAGPGRPRNARRAARPDQAWCTATPRRRPYSTGTWGSRCAVMAGGAVAAACDELAGRMKRIGAHAAAGRRRTTSRLARRRAWSRLTASVAVAEVARTWYRRPQDLPADVDPGGLEVTAGYKPQRDSGTFSYAAHAVVVAVDTGDWARSRSSTTSSSRTAACCSIR